MKKKIRLIEDFPKVEHCYGKYYAYNSETGESAILNDEKQLLFYNRFPPGGELCSHPTHHVKLSHVNWEHDDLLPIVWASLTNHNIIKFGLYNIKTRSYVIPMDNYNTMNYYNFDETVVFLQSNSYLFIVDNDGNLLAKLSNSYCKCFKRDFYDFKSKTFIISKEIKCEYGLVKYKYGVYSCKEKKIIIPIEFDKIENNLVSGFIVTKDNQMGIYSYEGEILTNLDSHDIKPICSLFKTTEPLAKLLVQITDKSNNTGVFTLDNKCIIPMEYRAIYYHSDEFIIVQNHNLSWTVYSVSKKKFLISPCIGVIINDFEKDDVIKIYATKYIQLAGYSGYQETVDDVCYVHHGRCIVEEDSSYTKFVPAKYKYIICYDVYSINGELIRENVIDTIYESKFCNPFLDSCIPFSHRENKD